MRYPEKLNQNDIIGITAPSMGLKGERNFLRADNAKKNLESKGYKVIETQNVRTSEGQRSSSKEKRAEQFMELWKDEKVKSIIMADGGDFLCEMLEELNFEEIKKYPPKWIQGFSDITNLGYVFTTNLDIATIYGPNYKAFGMRKWHESLENSIKLMNQEELTQNSYEKYEKFEGWTDNQDSDPYEEYHLTEKVIWKNLNNEEKIHIRGRAIGGCFDVIVNLIGTKYDKTSQYIEKYKGDGIIWFLEAFEMTSPKVYLRLWQMKNAGYFKNCNGIIFGRPLMIREDYDMKFHDAVKQALEDLDIPIIYDADIGHVSPQIPIVNGGIIEVISENGKGMIKNFFR